MAVKHTEPAIVADSGQLTHGELETRVGALATRLTEAGLGAGHLVAIALDEPVDGIVGLLGVARSRAAFVWLDGDQPEERRRAVLADCAPHAVLTDAGLESQPSGPTLPHDTLCLVYTSGSTGTPKGIVQRRPNMDQFIEWFAGELDLRPGNRMLQWARLSYDAAYAEIFSALSAGATLVVLPTEVRADPVRLADRLGDDAVTHLLAVPTLAHVLARRWAERGVVLPAVRAVGLFGEALPPALVHQLRSRLPNAALYNLYGPTECTLATYHRIPRRLDGPVVPIGREIPGRTVVLRDETGAVTATGPGEVHVRSRFLARGYLNRPEETARAFLPGRDGDGIYRTGDLARREPDGTLVFLGRRDEQVKVRGVRVELGEIEAQLLAEPSVTQAAATVHGDGVERRVAVFLQARPGGLIDVSALHRRLTGRLATAMMPGAYYVLDRMPHTATGKIDRARLRDPQSYADRRITPVDTTGGQATDTERRLRAIWRDVLDDTAVDVNDEFFTIGGHSMLAPRISAAVAETLGVRIPARAVFDHPRLRDLARYIDSLREQRNERETPCST